MKTMRAETKIVERLKAELLDDLRLMRPADLEAYWQQTKWPKPNLVELSKSEFVELPQRREKLGERARVFAPLRYALKKLPSETVADASETLDPFGWLLEAVGVNEWCEFCRTQHAPWMTRIWLAAASQLRAECRLIFKSHGWSDTWENLRRNPKDLRSAVDFFSAQLNHARRQRRTEQLAIRVIGLSETSLRRLRRARKGIGKRAGVAPAENFTVQHWLELPYGLPGLCFFRDTALHSLLVILGLLRKQTEAHITTLLRGRLGLIQAATKRHLVEHVSDSNCKLSFTGSMITKPWTFEGKISWGSRGLLWPQ